MLRPVPTARRALLACLLALVGFLALVGLGGAIAAEPPGKGFDPLAATVRKAVDSENFEEALRAYARLADVLDPRGVDLVIETTVKIAARRDAVARGQEDANKELSNALAEIEKANATPPVTAREIDEYNKRTRRIEAKRDAASAKLRDIGLEIAQWKAVLVAASAAAGHVIEALPKDRATEGLAKLTAAWFAPKSPVDDKIRWIDAVTSVKSISVDPTLHDASMDEAQDPRVRGVALSARVARGDKGVLEDAISLLAAKDWTTQSAAIDGLRRLHLPGAIEPLIAYLGRDDKELGRLRLDAQRALKSLTGQKHGPYMQPWKDWWETAKPTFQMPERPTSDSDILKPEKGVTFYGITTTSDKILFILDVSGSMLETAKGDPNAVVKEGGRKIDVARRELKAALSSLDPSKKFNILFFGNKVIRYQVGMIVADPAAIERAIRFMLEVEPSGGTNIHDALETGFKMAGSAADGKNYDPVIDTFYFMTDGTPTAGKLKKPDEILAAVREWNRTARICIHGIAVGEACDAAFLKTLAEESNGGQYVHR